MTGPIEDFGGRRSALARYLRTPAAVLSLLIIAGMIMVAVFAPWIAPYDPNLVDYLITKAAPSPEHLLGGDSSGRDVFSRLLWGARPTLLGGLIACLVSIVLGAPAGIIAGYYGGLSDSLSSWLSDALQATPGMIVLLIVAAGSRSNLIILMLAVGVLLAPGFFRLTRATTRTIRQELYVSAAKVSGLRDSTIIVRHLTRQVVPAVLIQGSLTVGLAMGLQAGLQFLGIGSARTPSWGAMLNDGFRHLLTQPLLLLWPSLALGLAIAAFAVAGSSFADHVSTPTRSSARPHPRRMRAAAPDAQPANAVPDATTGSISVAASDAAVRIDNLRVHYHTSQGRSEVVHGIRLDVAPGEVLGIVGESGSGKSQTVFSVLDLLPAAGRYTADAIWIGGENVTALPKRARARLLGRAIGYIPQDPMVSLDPSFTIGHQLVEPLRAVHGMRRNEAKARALAMLVKVGIHRPEQMMTLYPHQLSGGMAQRVLIAGAICGLPSVLIADEPTTALDVTVQAEVLELLRELQQEYRMALILVTHNFGVVADICDRVVVMREGNIIEIGDVATIFDAPRNDYTRELIAASQSNLTHRAQLDRDHLHTPTPSTHHPHTQRNIHD